jgi:hypothetical protein
VSLLQRAHRDKRSDDGICIGVQQPMEQTLESTEH